MRAIRGGTVTRVAVTGAATALGVLIAAGPASAASTPVAATGGGPLHARAAPTSASRLVANIRNGSRLTISCQVAGVWIRGSVRGTAQWDRLSNGSYVSDGYVRRGSTPARCPVPAPAPPPAVVTGVAPASVAAAVARARSATWSKPLRASVGGGFRPPSNPAHDGVDIMAARNTSILAISAGRVITAECNASTHNCNVDGSPKISGCGWYVEVQHPSGIVSRYCHMIRTPSVRVGQSVGRGQLLGYVGTSGNSSGPHLHFEIHTGAPATRANAIDPVPFMIALGAPLGTG